MDALPVAIEIQNNSIKIFRRQIHRGHVPLLRHGFHFDGLPRFFYVDRQRQILRFELDAPRMVLIQSILHRNETHSQFEMIAVTQRGTL